MSGGRGARKSNGGRAASDGSAAARDERKVCGDCLAPAYSDNFQKRLTSNGDLYRHGGFTAALLPMAR